MVAGPDGLLESVPVTAEDVQRFHHSPEFRHQAEAFVSALMRNKRRLELFKPIFFAGIELPDTDQQLERLLVVLMMPGYPPNVCTLVVLFAFLSERKKVKIELNLVVEVVDMGGYGLICLPPYQMDRNGDSRSKEASKTSTAWVLVDHLEFSPTHFRPILRVKRPSSQELAMRSSKRQSFSKDRDDADEDDGRGDANREHPPTNKQKLDADPSYTPTELNDNIVEEDDEAMDIEQQQQRSHSATQDEDVTMGGQNRNLPSILINAPRPRRALS